MNDEKIAELEELLNNCHAGIKHLLGDVNYPNATGIIVQMNNHLSTLNGTVADILKAQIVMKEKQNNLLSRFWKELPAWLQAALFVQVASTITCMGLGIDFLIRG